MILINFNKKNLVSLIEKSKRKLFEVISFFVNKAYAVEVVVCFFNRFFLKKTKVPYNPSNSLK
jgi:hypothetical protein